MTTRKTLTALEKIEAGILTEEMFLKGTSERAIVGVLVTQYAITKGVARAMLNRCIKDMQGQVAKAKPYRRDQLIARLDALYERCLDAKKYGVANSVLAQMAKILGAEKPQRHVHTGTVAVGAAGAEDPEFAGKTPDELDYYAEHGHWPEDSNEPVEPMEGEPEFPLH